MPLGLLPHFVSHPLQPTGSSTTSPPPAPLQPYINRPSPKPCRDPATHSPIPPKKHPPPASPALLYIYPLRHSSPLRNS
ncbi:unnamed protein product [Dicrocoelium dendriticum]|nr:unnamed protein product [Dicrocoelium dendriticum]